MHSALVDTDVLIWFLRGNEKSYLVLSPLDQIIISTISYMELIQGLRNQKELKELRQFISEWELKIELIDERINIRAMSLMEQLYLSHSLHLSDAIIAATAIHKGLPLLTGNTKHFKGITGLELKSFSI